MQTPSPSPDESEPLGPVERELVRLLRLLDLSELQPGVRERCWEEFRVLAGIPESPVASARPEEAPAQGAEADDPASVDPRPGREAPARLPASGRLRARLA